VNYFPTEFSRLPEFETARRRLQGAAGQVKLTGLSGSARSLAAAALFEAPPGFRRALLVTPGVESALRICADLQTFLDQDRVRRFPFAEVLPDEDLRPPAEIEGQRLLTLNRLLEEPGPLLVVAPVQALMLPVPEPEGLKRNTVRLIVGREIDRPALIEFLDRTGYERCDLVAEPGNFAVRGGIIDLFPLTRPEPIRIELSGRTVISLRRFNPQSQLSSGPLEEVDLLPGLEKESAGPAASLSGYFPPRSLLLAWEPGEIATAAGQFLEETGADRERRPSAWENFLPGEGVRADLVSLRVPPEEPAIRFESYATGSYTLKGPADPELWKSQPLSIFCRNETQSRRLKEVLVERGLELHPGSRLLIGYLWEGFTLPAVSLTLLTDSEIFGRYRSFRPTLRPFFLSVPYASVEEIKPGDYVVHLNEGIGRFEAITRLKVGDQTEEVLKIEYADQSSLYVPVSQINLVHRYAGAEKPPVLSRLGSRAWIRTRERVKRGVRDLASDLLRIYQQRREESGTAYPADTEWQSEFENEFLYEETPDQQSAIAETKANLASPRPMDRLICGDVGYGKTEVAMRAAFKVVESGRQVALICPTTILAEQHRRTFRERFADFPVRIENLSRFRSRKEQQAILADLADGKVDIIIGTHRLLSRDVRFKKLGLWVVDEEQRFGVTHKERLRANFPNLDILTLTATPIPRTLQLSLVGIRDLSVIETPPAGRLSILTFVSPYRTKTVVRACRRELERDGQVFFIHNRVEKIERVADHLKGLVPEARIDIAHGQMEERQLSGVMERFLDRQTDILVSTSIIESGLDIPTANTIIINNGQNFGLADLYQLRGRVGRYSTQAYCYLFYDPGAVLTDEARRRLKAIEDFSRLGSGMRLALADLEIRGAGNLLGREQHGFIEAVGFYLYSQLFREAVAELTGQAAGPAEPDGPVSGIIPADYIPSELVRLSIYRRLFGLSEDADRLARELADRFGPVPEETRKLLRSLYHNRPPLV